jgi:demethylmacrocin O-methyltransferase
MYYRVLTKLQRRFPNLGLWAWLGQKDLNWLAILHQTDKRRGKGGHGYAPQYEHHFARLRTRPIRLLEIGVLDGASLRMWHDYFRNANIVGLDLKPPELQLDRVTLVSGDQSDPTVLAGLGSGFDVIIDDGSHVGRHIVASFEALFPSLNSHGFYVIEDMQTAYDQEYEGGPVGTPGTSVALVKDLIDAVNRLWSGSGPPVAALHVYNKIAFIEKA